MNKKRLWVTIGVISLFFLGIFSILVYKAATNDIETSSVAVPEYENIFIKNAQSKLQLLVTTKSKIREPFSNYIYDGKFNIFVFRFF